MSENMDVMLSGQQNQMSVSGSTTASREASSIQAALVIAMNNPRDEIECADKIRKACQRKSLASQAIYSYPRGGGKIEGPSVQLARAVATIWGNMDYGIEELEQRNGESVMEAYAWDLENNVRESRKFTVKHVRKARDKYVQLDDSRDIYEMTANMGARRLRACLLDIIPSDIIEDAVDQCNRTLSEGLDGTREDNIKKLVSAFDDLGVSKSMLEARLSYPVTSMDNRDIVAYRKIWKSINDGIGKREDFFNLQAGKQKESDFTKEMLDDKKKEPEKKKSTKKAEDPVEPIKPVENEKTDDFSGF